MIYTLKNYRDINSIYLHDFELKDITINYNSKELTINLSSIDNKIFLFNIKFYSFSIEGYEPWGEGIYIDSFSIDSYTSKSELECIEMELLLNSGDKLKILAKEISIENSLD
jgi:hypothetical protein